MNQRPTTYWVWRRSDGYVSATASRPHAGRTDSFDILLETTDWPVARTRILAERGACPTCEGGYLNVITGKMIPHGFGCNVCPGCGKDEDHDLDECPGK